MKTQFNQSQGSTSRETNKEAIARIFGLKKSQVGYLSTTTPIDSYVILFDKETQTCWYRGTATGTPTSWLVTGNTCVLNTNAGAFNLNIANSGDILKSNLSSTIGSSMIGSEWGGTIKDAMVFVSPSNYGGVANDPSFDNSSVITLAATNSKFVDLKGLTWYISSPIYVPSGCIIQNGKIVSTAVKDGPFMTGSIFAPGNYHPVYVDNIAKSTVGTSINSSIVTVDPTGFSIGELVRISSTNGITNGSNGFIPKYMQLAKIIGKTNSTIILDSPIESSDNMVLHKANNTSVNGRFDKPLFVCENSIIRDIEIDTWDYWTADSATYNVLFENIKGKAKSVVYGNTFCRTTFKNINIAFRNKACELAFGTHNTLLEDIEFISNESDFVMGPAEAPTSLGISLAESGRHCTLERWKLLLGSNATPPTVFRISSHSDVIVRNGEIRIVSNTNNVMSVEHYGGERCSCENILLENISINISGSATVVMDVYKSADDSVINNVEFKNISYSGVSPSVSLIRQRGTVNNPVTGIRGSIKTKVTGAFNVSNASEYDFKLYGPFTLSSAIALDAYGKIQLINSSRTGLKSQNYTTSTITQITSTDPANKVWGFNYPAGSLRSSDEISLFISGSYGQLNGTKNISVGVVGSSGEVLTTLSALATEEGFATFDLRLRVVSDVYVLLSGYMIKGNVITPVRSLVPVNSLATNALVMNIYAWKQNLADGLAIQKITAKLVDVTG